MKKKFLYLLFQFFCTCLIAQQANFEWVKPLSNTTNKNARAVFTDAAGNVYTTGQFSGTIDFDPGTGVYNLTATATSMYILKLDATGNFVWARQIGGAGTVDCTGASLDEASGTIYCCGRFQGNIDFDPGTAAFNLATTSYSASFILKLHVTGTFIWAKQIASIDFQSNAASAIKTDRAGNVYTTGNFSGTADFDPGAGNYNLGATQSANDMYLLKLDAAGNFIWTKQISGFHSSATQAPMALAIDNAGNIYTGGYFDSTVDFDPGIDSMPLQSKGNWDAFLLKLNASGDFVWVKTMGGNGQNSIVALIATDDGNLYASGYATGTVDADPGAAVLNLSSKGNSDCYISKLDANGNLKWATLVGGPGDDAIVNMATDDLQNIYCTGHFKNTVDFDPGAAVYNLSSAGSFNSFMLKLTPGGNMLWAKQLTTANIIFGSAIAVDAQRNIYTAGNFTGLVDFDPNAGIVNISSATNSEYDVYIHKMNQPCTAGTIDTLSINSCTSYQLNNDRYTESGTYRQVLLNMAGCDSSILLQLTINRIVNNVNKTACAADGYFAEGALQHTSGSYTDTLQTRNGCDSVVITQLAIQASPQPNLGADREICPGESIVLTPGAFNSYTWNDNSSSATHAANAIGKYWVTVTGSNNCTATDTMEIIGIRNPPAGFLPQGQAICLNSVFNLTIPGYKTYLWSNGATGSSAAVSTPGTYYLTVKDQYNCTGTDSIIITRADCVPFAIVNAFSPNNDGKNDLFKPVINQVVIQYHLVIYNRLGEKLFETTDPSKPWDGTYRGYPQDTATYTYQLSFTNSNGKFYQQKGTVILLR